MNNLQIIAVGTLISVTLIEALLSNWRLRKALKKSTAVREPAETAVTKRVLQKGFIDYKTGRRVTIDPTTRKEVFID